MEDNGEETKGKKKAKDNPFSFFNYITKDKPPEIIHTNGGINTPPKPTTLSPSVEEIADFDSDLSDDELLDNDVVDDEDEDNTHMPFVPPAAMPSTPRSNRSNNTAKGSIFDDEDDFNTPAAVAAKNSRRVPKEREGDNNNNEVKKVKKGTEKERDKSDAENTRLVQENADLKARLKAMQTKVEQADARVVALESKLKKQKASEAAEAKELEDMIAQVEANLAKTTHRAQQAEVQIEQLKIELANSRMSLRGDDNVSQSAEHFKLRLLEARDKAKVASSILMASAADAERDIRQLLKGVDGLRTASGILAAIDKLTIIDSNL